MSIAYRQSVPKQNVFSKTLKIFRNPEPSTNSYRYTINACLEHVQFLPSNLQSKILSELDKDQIGLC